ncbi:putative zinc finger, CCHC-type containing protein [Tanacetum coccineum]
MVIIGFDQREGTDYKHTFSPVAKVVTVRVLIVIATAKEWPLHQLDVNNAFLHGYVEEYIYMKPPEGYSKAAPRHVCKLSKSFYGLKTDHGTYLHQRKYALNLLQDVGLTAGKPATFPLPQNLKLSLDKGSPLKAPDSYKRHVGRFLYFSMTRPYISYTVQHLSQFISAPKKPHMQAALHLLRYLKDVILKGLFYPAQPQIKAV